MADYKDIAGRIRTTAADGFVVEAQEMIDLQHEGKSQQEINSDVQQGLSDRYTKEETYNRDEIETLVDPTNYVSVVATSQTTAVTDLLPATGAADTIYRIGNWDGTQYDPTVYALYSWNGTAYVCLAVRTFVGEIYDISANHPDGQGNPAVYADLAAALGASGANIPADIRQGGMVVKFIQQLYTVAVTTTQSQPTGTLLQTAPGVGNGSTYKASDLSAFATLPTTDPVVYYVSDGESTPTYTVWTVSKNATASCAYLQYRLMTTNFSTTVTDWQGVDDEPTAGSVNLVKSGGAYDNIILFQLDNCDKSSLSESEVISTYHYYRQGVVATNIKNSIGDNIGDVVWGAISGFNTVKIPISAYDFVSFRLFASTQGSGSFVTDASGTILEGYSTTKEGGYFITIKVPESAEYLYYAVNSNSNLYVFDYYISKFVPLNQEVQALEQDFDDLSQEVLNIESREEVVANYEQYDNNKRVLGNVASYVGQNVSQIPLVVTTGNQCIKKIPISNMSSVYFTPLLSSEGNGFVITDANGTVLAAYTSTNASDFTRVEIPQNAAYLYYTLGGADVYKLGTNKTDSLSFKVDELDDSMYRGGQKTRQQVISDYQQYQVNKVLRNVSSYVGQNVSDIPLGIKNDWYIIRIPVNTYKYISFRVFSSSEGNGSVITDGSGTVLTAYTSTSGYNPTIEVPQNAVYLYYCVGTADTNTFSYTENRIDALENEVSSIDVNNALGIQSSNLCSIKPSLMQGRLVGGELDNDGHYVTTTPIFGNFYIELNNSYRIYSASLIHRSGNIVADYYLSPLKHDGNNAWTDRKTYGCYNLPSGYGVLVSIVKSDQGNLSISDCIIKKFSWLNDYYYNNIIPTENAAPYWAAWRRSRIIQKVLFTPLSKLPARGSLDSNFYLKDKTYLGVPYSGVREYDKFVGVDVSMRTFLSALMNKRSLVYTENLRTGEHHSDYGFTYENDDEACTYFGIVCSSFVAYVLGIDIVYPSNSQGSISGMTKIENFTANDIQPLDVIVTSGHVSIITDVLTDKNNQKKYICWAEAASPLAKITPYSLDEFMARYNREKGVQAASGLYRYSALSSLTVEDNTNLVEIDIDDYVEGRKFNKSICTFAGDYAAFLEGQTIYLNAKPADTYTKIVIEEEGGNSHEINISNYTPDADEYIDVNITSLNLTDGLFTAILQNQEGSVSSEPTHFEIIKAAVAVTSSGSTRNITFDYGHAAPFAVCLADANIIYNAYYLTQEQISAKEISLVSAYSRQVKLYVKGEYGIVAGKASMS